MGRGMYPYWNSFYQSKMRFVLIILNVILSLHEIIADFELDNMFFFIR